MAIALSPASRFAATADTASFATQIGKKIYSKVERPGRNGALGPDLTWRTATGAMLWLGKRCCYLPLFFWRKLR